MFQLLKKRHEMAQKSVQWFQKNYSERLTMARRLCFSAFATELASQNINPIETGWKTEWDLIGALFLMRLPAQDIASLWSQNDNVDINRQMVVATVLAHRDDVFGFLPKEFLEEKLFRNNFVVEAAWEALVKRVCWSISEEKVRSIRTSLAKHFSSSSSSGFFVHDETTCDDLVSSISLAEHQKTTPEALFDDNVEQLKRLKVVRMFGEWPQSILCSEEKSQAFLKKMLPSTLVELIINPLPFPGIFFFPFFSPFPSSFPFFYFFFANKYFKTKKN